MSRLENIKETFKSVRIKIDVFLRRQRWREILIFSFFLFLSFSFWLLQSMNQEYEIEITVPVRYENIPIDVAFVQEPPTEIRAIIKDKGSVLINYSLFGKRISNLTATQINFAIKEEALLIIGSEIENHIKKQLKATTSLISFSPSHIDIHYNKRMQKKVPISFSGNIQPSSGYGLSNGFTLNPDSINIYAHKSFIDSVKEVKTVFLDIKNVSKTVSRSVKLQKVDGVFFENKEVLLLAPIEEFTEKTLSVPINCINVPYNFTVRIFPPTATVVCNIPLSVYKNILAKDFAIDVDFKDLKQADSESFPIIITKEPDMVKYTTTPEKFEFVIEYITFSE